MAVSESMAPPKIAQLAFCTSDLPQSVRLYSEAFGFAPAGGNMVWGQWLADIQDLGEDAATAIAWLVGRQDLLQLEFFNHTLPRPRPLADDWRPSDLGWVRWGLTVPDFEPALERLGALGVSTITEPGMFDGLRRVCFRDPGTNIVVELLEDGTGVPGGVRPRFYDLAPAVVYATLSVPDLEAAREFYLGTLGLLEDGVTLHTREMERLWGLPGAESDSFVAHGGDVYLEVVRYEQPVGRRRPEDHRLSDQGFMNIAVGSRVRAESEAMIERARADGYRVNADMPGVAAGGTYMSDGHGNSIEVISAPREFDSTFGFAATAAVAASPGVAGGGGRAGSRGLDMKRERDSRSRSPTRSSRISIIGSRVRDPRIDVANDDWRYGVSRPYMEELIGYWRTSYDWREHERRMNQYPHYKVTIDDVPIHFIHAKGNGPEPIPLILSHGWPWSFWDFEKTIGPLTDPSAHGGDARDSFDVVAPSRPGFGFSTPQMIPVRQTPGLSRGVARHAPF